jgi:O-antigen/teichoic acid export membrane protein
VHPPTPTDATAPATAPPRIRLRRAAAWVAPASFVANVLGYAFNLVLSRWLGPAGYGELGALLSLGLIGLVPALAVQPVVARSLARAARAHRPGLVRASLRHGLAIGAVTAALVVLSLPLVTLLLRVETAAVLWLAVSLLPAPVITAAQGVAQGGERFRVLGAIFVVAAVARLIGGIAGVLVLGGAVGALAGTAVGALVAAAVAVALTGTGEPGSALPGTHVAELAGAAVALAGLLVLGNVDVLLARNRLGAEEAGLYAVGAVIAKAGFWAPQFVQVVVFARLAEGGDRRLLGRSIAVVGGAGVALVAVCAVLGRPLVELAFGEQYAALGGYVWIFAAHGSVLALAQLLLYARLAAADRRMGAAVAAIVVVEVAVVVLVGADTPVQVALVALAGALMLAAVAGLLQRPPAAERLRAAGTAAGGGPAGTAAGGGPAGTAAGGGPAGTAAGGGPAGTSAGQGGA